jgi:hypothetical protein
LCRCRGTHAHPRRSSVFVVAVPNPITETFAPDEADLLLSSLDQLPLDELLERASRAGS